MSHVCTHGSLARSCIICELTAERDDARANYQWMVDRAADEKLDGYRELGAIAARAENEAEHLRAELAESRAMLATATDVSPVTMLKEELRVERAEVERLRAEVRWLRRELAASVSTRDERAMRGEP